MADIKTHLNNIKGALYGKDIRSSIHDGIDTINKEVESTTGRQVDLENTFDQLIINAGNSNAEIVDARVKNDGTSYSKLGDRLDAVDSQLAYNVSDLEQRGVNVKSFGAKGDGETDDTDAIQKAINKNNGVVIFPNGIYVISSPLKLKQNTILQGVASSTKFPYSNSQKCVLKLKNSSNCHVILIPKSENYICIRDLVIDGNRDNQSSPSIDGIHIEDAIDGSIDAEANFYIENCYVKDCKRHGVYGGRKRPGVHSIFSTFENNGVDGVHIQCSDNLIFSGEFYLNGNSGIYCNNWVTRIQNVNSYHNKIGLEIGLDSKYTWVNGCSFDNSKRHGIYCVGSDLTVKDTQFHLNSQEGDGLYPDLQINSPSTGNIKLDDLFFFTKNGDKLPNYNIFISELSKDILKTIHLGKTNRSGTVSKYGLISNKYIRTIDTKIVSNISNFNNEKFSKGDIIYNDDVKSGGYIGWVATATGIHVNKILSSNLEVKAGDLFSSGLDGGERVYKALNDGSLKEQLYHTNGIKVSGDVSCEFIDWHCGFKPFGLIQ